MIGNPNARECNRGGKINVVELSGESRRRPTAELIKEKNGAVDCSCDKSTWS